MIFVFISFSFACTQAASPASKSSNILVISIPQMCLSVFGTNHHVKRLTFWMRFTNTFPVALATLTKEKKEKQMSQWQESCFPEVRLEVNVFFFFFAHTLLGCKLTSSTALQCTAVKWLSSATQPPHVSLNGKCCYYRSSHLYVSFSTFETKLHTFIKTSKDCDCIFSFSLSDYPSWYHLTDLTAVCAAQDVAGRTGRHFCLTVSDWSDSSEHFVTLNHVLFSFSFYVSKMHTTFLCVFLLFYWKCVVHLTFLG